MPRLVITLLGNSQASLQGQPVLRLESGKTGALLAYLATEAGRAHSRQTLVELFWPERSNTQALNSLRYALANLRTTLQDHQTSQPVLLVARSQVQFNPQADVWVDVLNFQERAGAFEAAVGQGLTPSLADLQTALALYQGSFLQGASLDNSLSFESWALRKREQLERLRLRLLYFLGAGLEANGSFTQAEEAYRRILDAQPWDENTHQRLMYLLASTGQYAAAMTQYEACRRALHEIDIEPGRETHLLYNHIKRQQTASLHADTLLPDTLNAPPGLPFVARERELDRLDASLTPMLGGQGQVVFISGEAGSGKTALLHQSAVRALTHHPDLLVVGGRCDAYAGLGQPYQPFIESIQMLAGEWETLPWVDLLPAENLERLKQAVCQTAQVLIQKSPDLLDRFINRIDLAQRLPETGANPLTEPLWEKLLNQGGNAPREAARLESGILFEQITRFFTEMARHKPLVLLLDDIQWIDAGSAALLFHLARRMAASRILMLAAYRPGEINQNRESGPHPLPALITELQRYGGNIRIDLDRVNEQAFVSDFLAQDPLLQPNQLDKAFCAALARRTGGNPLFTIELLRSLQARGEIRRSAEGCWVSSPTLDWDHLPERVEAAIAGRIARLPSQWLDWLSTASVEGESFSIEVLARVHGVDEKTLLQDLSGPLGLSRAGHHLLQAEGVQWIPGEGQRAASLSRYRFRHILFQTYLYRQLDAVERSRRHAAVGAALEGLYAGQPDNIGRYATDLARHFEAGGLPEKAARYHLQAGKQAIYLASAQVAVGHYRRGLELLAPLPHSPGRDRLEISLYLALGAPFLSASGWGGTERQQAIQQALDLLRHLNLGSKELPADSDAPTADWPNFLMAIYAQADWLTSQGKLNQAIELGKQMLELTGEQNTWLRALAHRTLGISYLFQGKLPFARQHLEAALAVNAASKQPPYQWWLEGDLEIICRAMLGFVLAVSSCPARGQEQIDLSLGRARSLKRLSPLGSGLIFACEVAALRADLPTLRSLADELLQVGEAEGEAMRFFRAYAWGVDGYIKVIQASPGSEQALSGLASIRQGMAEWKSTDTRAGLGQWVVRLATACLHAGQVEAGLEAIAGALAESVTPWVGAGGAQIHRLRGELLLRQDRPGASEEAQACFLRSLEIAREQEAHLLELQAALCLAKLWQATQPAQARELLAEACGRFTQGREAQDWQDAQALLKEIQPAGNL